MPFKKKILAGAAALALLASPALAQPVSGFPGHDDHGGQPPAMQHDDHGDNHGDDHGYNHGDDHPFTMQHDDHGGQPMAMQHDDHGGDMHGPGPGGRPWARGDHFDGRREVVGNYSHYHLNRPPHGYEWVNSGGQFVMIAVASGVVASIIAGAAH